MTRTAFGCDTETYRIAEGLPYPPMVCSQFAWKARGEDDPGVEPGTLLSWIGSKNCDHEALRVFWTSLLRNDYYLLFANAQFDMIVLCLAYPAMEPLVWEKYARGEILDLSTMHKMLALAEWGDIDSTPFDDPGKGAHYGAADITMWYTGKDRSADKSSGPRTFYDTVADVPVSEWPANFVEYAAEDASDLVPCFEAMLLRADKIGYKDALLHAAGKRAAYHFAQGWQTYEGLRTDPARVLEVEAEVDEELKLDNFPLLIGEGVIVPGQPPQPYAKKTKAHVEDCPAKGTKDDCDCPIKMKSATKETLKRGRLQDVILQAARAAGDVKLSLTKGGIAKHEQLTQERKKKLPAEDPLWDANPKWLATDKDTFLPLAPHSEILTEYARRAAVIKLRTDYIHRFFWDSGNGVSRKESQTQCGKAVENQTADFRADKVRVHVVDRVRFNFKDLVKSGRIGSFAGNLYPSMNGQNPHPKIRGCFGADPGYILYSTDYGAQDLRSVAWRCLDLGISSILAALFQKGLCPHIYLGAALLRELGGNETPPELHGKQGMDAYEIFAKLKKTDFKKFKLWRTFAKPTGLGNWGGQGPATALETAVSDTYKLYHLKLEDMKGAQKVWRKEFPENKPYFDHVRHNLRDERHSGFDPEGEKVVRYQYTSPNGMIRSNCIWTEEANGFGLQNPSAEGMGNTAFDCVRASRDWTRKSPAYGVRFLDNLHDELLYQIPIRADFRETEAARAEVERLMCEGLGKTLKGMPIVVETVAMYRWNKEAKEAFTAEGWLVPADTPL